MKINALHILAAASLALFSSCIEEEDDYTSDSGGSTSFPRGSCTYTNNTNFDLYYHWQAVVAAWDNYERRQIDGTYAEQVGAYNNYVSYYNHYSDLVDQYRANGDLSANWDCNPDRLAGV